MTFEVIEKMHYEDFGKGEDDFKPSDIIDIEEEDRIDNQEEILSKFRHDVNLMMGQ